MYLVNIPVPNKNQQEFDASSQGNGVCFLKIEFFYLNHKLVMKNQISVICINKHTSPIPCLSLIHI